MAEDGGDHADPPVAQEVASGARRWLSWPVVVGALVIGAGIGVGATGTLSETASLGTGCEFPK